jgi:hypothetical protein
MEINICLQVCLDTIEEVPCGALLAPIAVASGRIVENRFTAKAADPHRRVIPDNSLTYHNHDNLESSGISPESRGIVDVRI